MLSWGTRWLCNVLQGRKWRPLIMSTITRGSNLVLSLPWPSPWTSSWHSQATVMKSTHPQRAWSQMMGALAASGKHNGAHEENEQKPGLSFQLCPLLIYEPRPSHLWNGYHNTMWWSCEDAANDLLLVKHKVLGKSKQHLWSGEILLTLLACQVSSWWDHIPGFPCFQSCLPHWTTLSLIDLHLSLRFWTYSWLPFITLISAREKKIVFGWFIFTWNSVHWWQCWTWLALQIPGKQQHLGNPPTPLCSLTWFTANPPPLLSPKCSSCLPLARPDSCPFPHKWLAEPFVPTDQSGSNAC